MFVKNKLLFLNKKFDALNNLNQRLRKLEANNKHKIDQVVIGINFSMFNKYSFENRVSSLKKIFKNPFLYIYNKDVLEACYFVLRSYFFNINLDSKPKMNKDQFWKWTIDVKGGHWYGKYDFPENIYADLIEFDNFTKSTIFSSFSVIYPVAKQSSIQ